MANSSDEDRPNIDLVRMVATRLVDEEDIEAVGRQLGFEYENVQRYITQNHRDNRITSEGTVRMLRNGLKKKKGRAISVLKEALKRANLIKLSEELEAMDSSLEGANPRRDNNSTGQGTPAQASGIRQSKSSITIRGDVRQSSVRGQEVNLGSSSEGRRDEPEGASIDQSDSTINVHGSVEGGNLVGQKVTGSSSQDECSGRKRKQDGGDQSAKNADKGMSEPWLTVYRACVNRSTQTIISSLGIIVLGLISRYLGVPCLSENVWVLFLISVLGLVVLIEVFRLWGKKQK